MPTLVGFTPNKLILNSSNFRREMAGLERIMDVYTSRTEDAEFFQEIIVNGASHRTITGYLSPIPPTSERYANMLVENVESTNEVGGITTYSVTYVGLFRELKPKPILSYQPIDRYAFNPYSISIEFVEFIGDVGSTEEFNFIRKYQRRKSSPKEINGYTMPQSSVPPFQGEITANLLPVLQGSQFFASALSEFLSQEETSKRQPRETLIAAEGTTLPASFERTPPTVAYFGLVISGISYQRYGKVAHTFLTASDSAYFSFIVTNAEGKPINIYDTINFEFGF